MRYLPSNALLGFLVFIFLVIIVLIVRELNFTGHFTEVEYRKNIKTSDFRHIGNVTVRNGSITEIEDKEVG